MSIITLHYIIVVYNVTLQQMSEQYHQYRQYYQYNRYIVVGINGDLWCSNHPNNTQYDMFNKMFNLDNSRHRRSANDSEYIMIDNIPPIKYVIYVYGDTVFLLTRTNQILNVNINGVISAVDNVIDAVAFGRILYYQTTDNQLRRLTIVFDRWSEPDPHTATDMTTTHIDDNILSIHPLILQSNTPNNGIEFNTIILVRYNDGKNKIGRLINGKLEFVYNLELNDVTRINIDSIITTSEVITLSIANMHMTLPTGTGKVMHDVANSRIVETRTPLMYPVVDAAPTEYGIVKLVSGKVVDLEGGVSIIDVKRLIRFISGNRAVHIEGDDEKIYILYHNVNLDYLDIPIVLA